MSNASAAGSAMTAVELLAELADASERLSDHNLDFCVRRSSGFLVITAFSRRYKWNHTKAIHEHASDSETRAKISEWREECERVAKEAENAAI